MSVDLKSARNPLLQLNATLRKYCSGNLQISLETTSSLEKLQRDSLYNPDVSGDFILCLNYRNQCVSSITAIKTESGGVEFSSKTQTRYEGNKYNLLLRSCLILLCQYIKINNIPVSFVLSRAINPVSIYLLAKYFHAQNEQLETWMEENESSYDALTPQAIQEFYDNLDFDSMEPEFTTEEEEANYFKHHSDIGNPVLMTIPINEPSVMIARKVLENTFMKLGCPKTGGKRTKHKQRTKNNKTNKKRIKCNNFTNKR